MNLTILERPTPLTVKNFKPRLVEELTKLKGELNTSLKVEQPAIGLWTRIEVSGEDSEVMTQLIANKFCLAQMKFNNLDLQENYPAQIVGTVARGLSFDMGMSGARSECIIPTTNLRAQLTDGKSTPLKQIVECYCLYQGMRASVRVSRRDDDAIEAWLADSTVDTFADWINTGLDRIFVFDCFRTEAESAILRAHLSRDIIALKPISLTIQSLICKLGTDAVGLIPKLGHMLRKQPLKPFQPKKITSFCRPW